jgi:hypothetical protein
MTPTVDASADGQPTASTWQFTGDSGAAGLSGLPPGGRVVE